MPIAVMVSWSAPWRHVYMAHIYIYGSSDRPLKTIPIRSMGLANLPTFKNSWWLNQPIWKICSSNWIISPRFGVKIKNTLKFSWFFMVYVGRYTIHGSYGIADLKTLAVYGGSLKKTEQGTVSVRKTHRNTEQSNCINTLLILLYQNQKTNNKTMGEMA